ncbi:MAG: T9SS type A sorting domain-containing protein [candidate division WOR-3 bacterium]|nr:T9SS type A sorting domain-containing protein [candidate division WOR-3 bacterium]MCX7837394.1 T9SS type A sorting domain-containing protein [candidate division WOR-3 bacterium]MDW8114309.1 CARDB domain-containing protein [candidate division WOR-3 bacterium]
MRYLIISLLFLNLIFAKKKEKINFYPIILKEKVGNFSLTETLNYDLGIVKIISPTDFISRQRIFPMAKIKNFGRMTANNFSVRLMIAEIGYLDIKNITSLLPFRETIINFNPFIPNESIKFSLKCTVEFFLDEDSSNNLKTKKVFIYDYYEGFEESEGEFISLPESCFRRLRWGRNNDWCFVSCDNVGENYHNMANFSLKSPPFFALVDSPIVAFWHKYNIEFYYDGYNLKCSTENFNWKILSAYPGLGQRYSTVASIYTLGIRSESCYSGYSDWQINYFKIPVLKNTKFYLRFDFGSDNADNEEGGAFIDNIYGIGFSNISPYFCLEIKEFTYPKEPIRRGEDIQPKIKVKNYSPIGCENILLRLRIQPGEYFSEKLINNLLPNQEAEVIFDFCRLDAVYNIFLCSLYYYPENNYSHSLSKIVFTYNYYEDFVNSNGYYRANEGWNYSSYFGLPNNPGGWSNNRYWNLANYFLKSPTFYALVDTPIIAYWHKYENEYRFDGYNVKCSIFGSSWQIIHSYPYLGQRYDTIARPGNAGIPNESCYAGYYPWRINYLKIPVDSGEFFKIGFHFGSDYDETYYGTEIDKIYGCGFLRKLLYDVGIKEIIAPSQFIKKESILPQVKIKNYGERIARAFWVYFYIDRDYKDSVYIQELFPESETLLTFSFFTPLPNRSRYLAYCKIDFPLDENLENNDVEYEFYVYHYLESFEAGEGGYTAVPESGWKYLNINDNWVFTTGIYENNANWKLLSPIFVVNALPPFLAYWHKYNTEFIEDGYNVKCSLAYPHQQWRIINPSNINYDERASPNNAGIPDELCFTGNRDWSLVFFNLPFAIGERFRLCFHFGSDQVNIDSGVIIDQIYGIGFDTLTVGIEEVDNKEFSFMPSIIRKPILINLPREEKIDIKIFDITGKLIYEKRYFDKKIVIKEALPKGVYFIKIKSNSLNIEKKIIFNL